MFSYSGSISSSNNYFKAFKKPHFGKFCRPAPSFKLDTFNLKLFQVFSTYFSRVASRHIFDHFHKKWGQHECLNKGINLCRKTFRRFSSNQSIFTGTKFQKNSSSLDWKKTSEQIVENCTKIDLLEAEKKT